MTNFIQQELLKSADPLDHVLGIISFEKYREDFITAYLSAGICMRCNSHCNLLTDLSRFLDLSGVYCCNCLNIEDVYLTCFYCRKRKAITVVRKRIDNLLPRLGVGQIYQIPRALQKIYNLDYIIKDGFEVNQFWDRQEFLLQQDPELLGQFVQQRIRDRLASTCRSIERVESRISQEYNCITESLRSYLWSQEHLLKNKQPEYLYYYDLIELRNGSHIPVTKIRPFWRKFFLKFARKKIRDDQFFICPYCKDKSFFSQWTNGCYSCKVLQNPNSWYYDQLYWNDHLKRAHERRIKRQEKKNRLLKRGTWIFFAKSYVIADKTKDHISRERVESMRLK